MATVTITTTADLKTFLRAIDEADTLAQENADLRRENAWLTAELESAWKQICALRDDLALCKVSAKQDAINELDNILERLGY